MEKKVTLRVDSELHLEMTKTAANKKLSLNEYLSTLLKQIHFPEPPKQTEVTDEQWERIINKI